MSEPRVWAVVPAAGKGLRMGADMPKQYLALRGRPVIAHTLTVLAGHPRVEDVTVAVSADDILWRDVAAALEFPLRVVAGGAERCESVFACVAALGGVAAPNDWILVHDAARPCLRATDIDRMLIELDASAVGGILAVPVRDTLKRAGVDNTISATVDRTRMWHALTPQMFRFDILHAALAAVNEAGRVVTDEAQAVELQGHVPLLVEGHVDNIKITHPADLALAELFLTHQANGH